MSNLTLLYAEDDPQSRKNYAFVLEEYFSKVYLAADGREALDLYHEKKPDVLLLDISMPYIDGLEVARAVRKENKEIPIIILTAHSEQEILFRAIDLKLEKYLLKPIDSKNLIEIVLKVIREIKDKDIVVLKEKLSWNKTNSTLYYEEKSIKLTKKEHKLMTLLINFIGEYFAHDALIIQIWDNEIPDASHDNKLHQLVHRLNKKIINATNSDTPLIVNTYKLGYRIQV